MTDTVQTKATYLNDEIEVLRPEDVDRVRVPWDARYTREEVEELAREEPGLCLWNRRTSGYLLGARWRHRHEIANVVDINGPSVAIDLLRAFIVRATEIGMRLAIVAEYAERRRETFYAAAGLSVLEEIIVYELRTGRKQQNAREPGDGHSVERVNLRDLDQRAELLSLDHRAFPWLWWNSLAEFENYAGVPGVKIQLVRDGDERAVGYIGTTSLGSWGHLDRIAVDPSLQGRGYGRILLDIAIRQLTEQGARRIALSTQASNTVSRALYESAGFRRSRAHDYLIYGRQLDVEPESWNETSTR